MNGLDNKSVSTMSSAGQVPAPTTAPAKVLARSSGSWSWVQQARDVESLCRIYGPSAQAGSTSTEAFVFLSTKTLTRSMKDELSRCFSIPDLFWELYYQRANGFYRCEELYDDEMRLIGFTTWFKMLVKYVYAPEDFPPGKKNYCWDEIIFFSKTLNNGFTIMLIFDASDKFRNKVESKATSDGATTPLPHPTRTRHMHKWHVLIFEVFIDLYDHSVWLIRDRIRAFEDDRSNYHKNPSFNLLHDIARHAIHSTETISVAVEVMELVLKHYQSLANVTILDQNGSPVKEDKELVTKRQTEQTIESQAQTLKAFKLRSQAVEDRVHSEINLSFNMVSQRDSNATVVLSQAAFIFLPATFICAVFSTTFFTFSSPDGNGMPVWQMSNKFWILWVVVVPITIFTYLIRPQSREGRFFRPRIAAMKARLRIRPPSGDQVELGKM